MKTSAVPWMPLAVLALLALGFYWSPSGIDGALPWIILSAINIGAIVWVFFRVCREVRRRGHLAIFIGLLVLALAMIKLAEAVEGRH